MDNSFEKTGDNPDSTSDSLNWSFFELANFLPSPIFVLDSTVTIVYWNAAAESLLGYSSSEVICQGPDSLFKDLTIFGDCYQPISAGSAGSLVSLECKDQIVTGIHRDGQIVPLEISLTPRKWQGEFFTICTMRDISEQIAYQNALSALNESEQRYRGIIDTQNTLVWRADREGRVVYANQAYCQMFGECLDDLIGLSSLSALNLTGMPSTLDVIQALDEPPYHIKVEHRIQTANGFRWIAWEYAMIQDLGRNLQEIQAVGYDITERKQVEEIAIIERNLAIILAQKSGVQEALPLVLDLSLQVAEMDCGGIYLVDRKSQDLVLMYNRGLSEGFVARANRFSFDSPNYKLVMKGTSMYMPYLQIPTSKNQTAINEGLHFTAIIPVRFKDTVIACLNVASHSLDDMPEYRRTALENLAFQIGNMIDRFQVQDELAESQHELKSMFDSLQDFVFVLDLESRIVQVNQKVIYDLGYSWKELDGCSVLNVHPPEEREEAARIVGEMLAGLLNTCPLNLLRKDGSQIPVETKVVHGRWGNQDVLIGVSRDITERKAAEDARLEHTRLLEYRNQFEEILTSISTRFINLPTLETDAEIDRVLELIAKFERVDRGYVFLLDRKNGLLQNSHAWCGAGVTPLEKDLRRFSLSAPPWWLKKLENLQEVYIPQVSQLSFEAWAEIGTMEWGLAQSVLLVPLVSQNVLVGFAGFDSLTAPRVWSADSILLIKMVGDALSNALMRRKMETELRESESRNKALLSAVPDIIYRIHRNGVLLDFKASSAELLFAPPDKIVGNALGNILEPALTEKIMECIASVLERKAIQTMVYTLKTGSSSRVYEARFKDSGADEVTMIIRDISDRTRLEQMKSDFINRATHELRTPISTMLLMVDLMDDSAIPVEARDFWDILKGEINREQMLVENLLNVGRLENDQVSLNFAQMEVCAVLDRVVSQMEMLAHEKEISITVHPAPESSGWDGWIEGDESGLTQVFVNLVGNALKYTPSGGEVNITVNNLGLGIEVSVEDTGIGIPSEDLPLLFSRFFRGTNAIENEIPGTGIGLFIARSIVEKHGGSVKVHSEIGKGSQFIVWLPMTPDPV